jgi:hypothetical protein
MIHPALQRSQGAALSRRCPGKHIACVAKPRALAIAAAVRPARAADADAAPAAAAAPADAAAAPAARLAAVAGAVLASLAGACANAPAALAKGGDKALELVAAAVVDGGVFAPTGPAVPASEWVLARLIVGFAIPVVITWVLVAALNHLARKAEEVRWA